MQKRWKSVKLYEDLLNIHTVLFLQSDLSFDLHVQVYETIEILNRKIEQKDLTMPLWMPNIEFKSSASSM